MERIPHLQNIRTIKEALHRMVHKHPTKSLEQIAEESGIKPGYLNKAILPDDDPNDSGCAFQLKMLIPLVRATGDFTVLDFIEWSLGRVAFPVPTTGKARSREKLVRAVKESSEAISTYARAIEDGEVDDRERPAVIREFREAQSVFEEIIRMLEEEEREKKPRKREAV